MDNVNNGLHWFVMRDLKRANSIVPAYKMLSEAGFEVFTPMVTKVTNAFGRRRKVTVPFIQDLLFVCSSREILDPIVLKTPTLQYRFVKGGRPGEPMEVPFKEMTRFKTAVEASAHPLFFKMDEISPKMLGANIRIISNGLLNNFEGQLLRIKGSGKKRLMLRLKDSNLIAAIEIASQDFVEITE